MFRKVIRSVLGEVAHDHRTVGDPIRYRIYYDAGLPTARTTTITDKVDARLDAVKPRHGGVFDPLTRTITWPVSDRPFIRKPYVEFDAVVAEAGVITNRASAGSDVGRPVRTNTVTSDATMAPPTGWIPLVPDVADGEVPRTWMKDETTTGITVRFDTPGIFVQERRIDGVAYQRIIVPGRAGSTEVGKPEVPVLGEVLEVPFGVDFTPEVVKAEKVELGGFNVMPAQPPRIDAGKPTYPFTIDATTYQTAAPFPAAPVSIAPDDVGIIRGHRVLLLKVSPVAYDPVAGILTVYTLLEVRIRFSKPAQVTGVNPRIRSPHFEQLLSATVLNYKDQERFEGGGVDDEQERIACDYLIITAGTLYNKDDPTNPVRRLAEWKQRKGYRTRVVRVGDISGGNTAASIKSYLQTAYDTWSPPPSYVLLVGDSDLVRPGDGHDHPGDTDPADPIPRLNSDLNHVAVDGSDYFPDMFIGRLPADTVQQVTDMVDKFIAYEQSPPTTPANAGFYTNASLIGLFTETDEDPAVITGEEDRPWIANLESVRDFLQGEGYTVDRIYATDTGFPGNPAAQDPRRYEDGTNLPNDLLHPQYAWDGGTNRIRNVLNAGRFLVAYRAHGWWGGWSEPAFGSANVPGLTQNDLTPLVVSITCQTGWFDNEVDDDTHGGRPAGDDTFAEAMMHRARAGAIGFIGMTRNSWTGMNDFLVFGAIKALWPEFNPDPHWAFHPAVPPGEQVALRRLGQITAFSKMFMARAYAAGNDRRCEFEMHHLFGDPELPVWTNAPGDLDVDHPKGIGADGMQEFLVKVTDKSGGQGIPTATVVLTRDGAIIKMAQTHTNGVAEFSVSSVGSGDLELTVTALGYRPYLGTLAVTPGGAELNVLDPDNGAEQQVVRLGGRNFSGGENVEVSFGSEPPFGVAVDAGGQFGQAAPWVEFTVPVGHAHELVNVTAVGATSHRRAVRVFQVRDKNPVDLWLYDQWNAATWTVHPGDNPTWNNPDIQLYDSGGTPVDSNNLQVGQTYTVRATVRNAAAFGAQNVIVVYQWENYGAGGPWQAFATPFVSVDAPASGTITADNEFLPFVTGHVCVLVTLEHPEDIDTGNNSGQENLHVGYASSPAEACFLVWNRTRTAAPVHFEVRQIFGPKQPKILWESWVKHPDPQILRPGDKAEACVIVDPKKADVPVGATAEFAVTCFIGSTMIGGVNLLITKK